MPRESPENHRERAANCERLADHATTTLGRDAMLYAASRWRALADHKEGKGRVLRESPVSPEAPSIAPDG